MRTLSLLPLLLIVAGCASSAGPNADGPETAASRELIRKTPLIRERASNPEKAMQWRRLQWQDENGEIPVGVLRPRH